jgi:hypothetical protein
MRRSFRRALPLIVLSSVSLVTPWSALPADGVAMAAPGPGAVVQLLDPILVAAREGGDVAALVARGSGGFLIAYTRLWELLLVGRHREDGSGEEVLRLGALGYSGAHNVKTLQPLTESSFVVTWDVDHHYAGLLQSNLELVGDGERWRGRSTTTPAPRLVPDGTGGAIGFLSTPEGARFGRWDDRGSLVRQRDVKGTGRPTAGVPFRGGLLVASDAERYVLQWFDADGLRVERTLAFGGGIATNGEDLVVELVHSSDGSQLRARFGSSPASLGPFRVLARVPAGTLASETALAIGPRRATLLAWTVWPRQPDCGIWLRAFSPAGRPLSRVLCAAGPEADSPLLAANAAGRVWFAWRTFDATSTVGRIWARRVALDGGASAR